MEYFAPDTVSGHAYFAPDAAPSGITSISSDLAAAYAIRAAVSSDRAAAYVVRSLVATDLAGSYTIAGLATSPVSSYLAGAYAVRSSVSATLQGGYQVESDTNYTRAPLGAGYYGHKPSDPDSLRRLGDAYMAVSLNAARLAARTDSTDLDDEIAAFTVAFTEEAEHTTQRAFGQQTWRATFSAFPAALKLPRPPLIAVATVKYYDEAGIQRTLDPQDYVVDADAEPAFITPAAGRAWPATSARANAVEVEYTCGFGPTDTSVPASLRQYILLRVQQQFAPVATAKPSDFGGLLDRYKIYA